MSPFGPGKLGLLFTAVSPIVMSASAMGQIVAVALPYFAVVEKDDAMMRCGGDDMLYPIAKLAKQGRCSGSTARAAVGRASGTRRIRRRSSHRIPFSLIPGGKTGTVTKPTKLKAFNLTTGLKGSWNSVFEQPVAVGTKLVILDAEPTPDGRGNKRFQGCSTGNGPRLVQTGRLAEGDQRRDQSIHGPGKRPNRQTERSRNATKAGRAGSRHRRGQAPAGRRPGSLPPR